MPNLKKGLIVPSPAENAAINAGIAADPDTYELSKAEFRQLRKVGRPPLSRPKVQLTVRYDQDIVEAFKADGPGWQTRMRVCAHLVRQKNPARGRAQITQQKSLTQAAPDIPKDAGAVWLRDCRSCRPA